GFVRLPFSIRGVLYSMLMNVSLSRLTRRWSLCSHRINLQSILLHPNPLLPTSYVVAIFFKAATLSMCRLPLGISDYFGPNMSITSV
ncbi:MAG: hypothetical protein EBT24_07425, partial [Betaproteobacteria bacterium]|nr:hypothetical protein [Betaproteobacteria bacterium]